MIILLTFLVLFVINIFLGEKYDRRNGIESTDVSESVLFGVFILGPISTIILLYYIIKEYKFGKYPEYLKPLTLVYKFVSKFVK